MRLPKLVVAFQVLVAACADGHLPAGFSSPSDGGGDAGPGFVVGTPAVGLSTDSGIPDGCTNAAMMVYVTGDGGKLYSFYPPTQAFTLIGQLACLSAPTHLTVDRRGIAWIVAGGQLYTASTGDASCAPVATWKADLPYADFSLAFIGTTAAPDDILYLMNDSVTLYTFNVVTGERKLVDPVVSVASTQGDMTSSGDGSLYFLRDANPHTLYQIDPLTAGIVKESSVDASSFGNQALAFWGGSFYAFENDSIYQFDPAKGTTKMIGTAPMNVTGAGQSTCVPKVPVIK